jgi:hypothetical protein
MSTLLLPITSRSLAALLLLSLCGCAVTRIDVDVYKGPMANHSDVQAEQLAALAMGAKPLLIELRDKFDRIKVGRDGTVTVDDPVTSKLDYRADFIPPPAPRESSGAYSQSRQWLVNQQAIQINAILSLYQDQVDIDIAELTSKAKIELENYRKSWEVYSNDDGQDMPIWKTFGLPDHAPKKEDEARYSELYKRYKSFLIANGGIRYQWEIPDGNSKRRFGSIGANAKFEELAQGDKQVQENALELFRLAATRKPEDGANKLVNRVRDVSQAFLDARGAIQKLLRLAFDIAERVSVPSFPESEGRKIKQACATFVVYIIEREFLYVALCEPNSPSKPAMISGAEELRKELIKKLGTNFFTCNSIYDEQDGSEQFRAFSKKKEALLKALDELIEMNTVATINSLRQIDLAIEEKGLDNCIEFTLPKGSNRFGLARLQPIRPTADKEQSRDAAIKAWREAKAKAGAVGMVPPPSGDSMMLLTVAAQPTPESSAQPMTSATSPVTPAMQPTTAALHAANSGSQPANPSRQSQHVNSHIGLINDDSFLRSLSSEGTFESGVGLEGGRLNDGLVTAINNYLNAARRYDQSLSEADKKTLDGQRRSLVRQLIHFSEKLIFIADNQFLLTRDHDGVSQEYGDLKTRQEFVRAAAVLETIGNSILVAANELYERDDYRTNRDSSTAQERVEAALKEIHLASGAAFREKVLELIVDPEPVVDSSLLKAQSKAKGDAELASKNLADATTKKENLAKQVATDDKVLQSLTKEKGFLNGELAKDADVLPILDEEYSKAPATTSTAKLLEAVKQSLRAKYDKAGDADIKDKLYARLDFVTRATPADSDKVVDKQTADHALRAAITASPDEVVTKANETLKQDQDAQTDANSKFGTATTADGEAKTKLAAANQAVDDDKAKKLAALNLVLQKFDGLQVTKVRDDAIEQALHDAKAAASEDQKKVIDDAIAVLPLITVPDSINIVPNKNNLTPRDAMDDLLVSLRLQHVNAVQQLGPSSDRVKQLEAAIHVAELYRSDMVYIRPPSAYLRTSNVATVFQQGGRDLQWQNLLQQQGFRSTPIFGNVLDAEAQGRPDYAAVRAIDRQFWQNINSVRVAGSGITNYVITKDDIGNWYVKNYAGNPQPIIDAAKSMALYNAGNAINGATAANRALQLEKNPDAPPQSEADLQISAFTTDYNTATTAQAAEIAGSGDKPSVQAQIDTALSGAWDKDSNLTDVKDQVKGVQTDAEKSSPDIAAAAGVTAKSDATKDTKLPDEILTTLKSFKAYQDRILTGIDNLHLDNSKTIQDKRQALAKSQTVQAAALAKTQSADASSQDRLDLSKADADVAAAQGDLNAAIAAAQQQISSAKSDVITSFSGILNPVIQKRLDTASSYSSALGVLRKASEAKNSTPAKKPAAKAEPQAATK